MKSVLFPLLNIAKIVPVVGLAVFIAGCASTPQAAVSDRQASTGPVMSATSPDTSATSAKTATGRPKRRTRASVTDPKRLLVVEGARSLLGKDVLMVKGETFPMDCTGLVRAAYWNAGIDLAKDFSKYTGNGVTRIFKTLEAGSLLFVSETPLPGDIIFWDNTYDRNEDGEWNDPLTHTGVVVAVLDNGQIEYAHANYRKGIVIEYMNLNDPDTNTRKIGGKVVFINSAMRMRGQVVNDKWLSSHLLREFGKGYLLN